MRKIRVLVVDDSVVIRRMVSDIVASDARMEVAGTASNGSIGLQKIPQVNPDVITLDVEMPVLDGLATLVEIRKTWPKLPVIMFSTLTERGATTTLDALTRGASDYVTKPANVGSVALAQQRVRDELLPKILALCGAEPPAPRIAMAAAPRVATATPKAVQGVDVLVLGVSTGGPSALAHLLPLLPGDLPVPVLIVQHMPPIFTRLLAERLDQTCQIRVREGIPGGAVEPGVAWIAPGDHHMVLRRVGCSVSLSLHQGPPENSCRPAVDPLFRSAVELYHERVLGVVLTGMGHDGLRGAEEIVQAGGQVLAQDEASSVVWGMPGYVANAGLADAVLPLDDLAREIIRRVGAGRVSAVPRPTVISG